MKKVLPVFLALLSINTFSQKVDFAEPEFVGDVILLKGTQILELEKQKAYEKAKQHFGVAMVLVGRDEITSNKVFSGSKSTIRIAQGKDLQFIAKVQDNKFSPFDIIDVVKLMSDEKNRKVQVARVGINFSSTSGDVYRIKFNAKKYGESSYLITIPTISQGEYTITVGSETFNLFGVDYYFNVNDKVEWVETNFNVLGDNKSWIREGKVIEIGKNKIVVEDDKGVKKTLNTINDDVRLINGISVNESLKPNFQVGQTVSIDGDWYGEIEKIEGNLVTVRTGDMGKEFTKSLNINSIKIAENYTLNTTEYSPTTIFDKINVNDKVKIQNPKNKYDLWLGTYIGVKDNVIGIKTTIKGKVIIKDIKIDDYILSKI